jgi:CBS domain-containing protein
VLRAVLWWKTGSLQRATKIAADVGKGLAIAIMALGAVQIFAGALIGGLWLVFIGMFLRSMAASGYQNLVLRRALDDAVVDQVMRRDPVTVPPSLSLRALVDDYVLAHGFRGFPVTDGGDVLGLISIDDLRKVPRDRWNDARVIDHMRKRGPEITVEPDAPLGDAMRKMASAGTGRLLVTHNGALVGMLSKDGLARFVEIRKVLDES